MKRAGGSLQHKPTTRLNQPWEDNQHHGSKPFRVHLRWKRVTVMSKTKQVKQQREQAHSSTLGEGACGDAPYA